MWQKHAKIDMPVVHLTMHLCPSRIINYINKQGLLKPVAGTYTESSWKKDIAIIRVSWNPLKNH